jgi:hypoxanthine phosphoribosyltransferase
MCENGGTTAQGSLYKEMLYTEAEVDARIAEMAADIVRKYGPTGTLFVSLLNGAQPFTAKLMCAIQAYDPHFHPNVQSMIVSRYGPNREPGQFRIVTDLPPDYRALAKYRVILLDDLVDRGSTLRYAREHLLDYGAQQVDCVVLVKKMNGLPVEDSVVTFGFETPNVWLTGMGMDDSRIGPEANRWAGWIAAANTD